MVFISKYVLVVEDNVKNVLRKYYGSFNTNLEQEYENKIVSELLAPDWNNKHKWATLNQIILEVKTTLNKVILGELLYRITDGEDPADCCDKVIGPLKNKSDEMTRLYIKIKLF